MSDDGVWALSLAEFRDATSSSRPTPGCGAAAAVVSDLGLALVLKALRVSEARRSETTRLRLLQDAESLVGRPGAFADDDIRAFKDYLDASRNQADSPADLQSASRQTCAVPLATARSCLQALGVAVAAWPLVVPVVRSDVQAGALLIHAGLCAALINVDADLPLVEDGQAREQAAQLRQRLQIDADALLRQLNAMPEQVTP